MRRFGFGLAAALVTVIMATATGAFAKDPISAAARDAGMKGAPAVVQAAGLTCALADARLITGDDPNDKFFEVACQDGGAYMIEAKGKAAPLVYPCLRLVPAPGVKPGNLQCELPANANPVAALKPILTKAGPTCTPNNARYLGSSGDTDVYEVACPASPGYLLQVPKSGPPVAANCISQEGSNQCTLTPPDQQSAYLTGLLSAKDPGCSIKGRRYIGATPDNNDFYEVACVSGKGYILQADPGAKLANVINCASPSAAAIGDGCKLADYRQAMTAENSVYSALAKKAGFDCAVSRYADFPTTTQGTEIVELACSNRADGGVAFFSNTTGQSRVYNCLRAEADGYQCSFTPEAAAYPRLSAELNTLKAGKSSCVVSGARPFAKDWIEVACADGNPGYVMVYADNSSNVVDLKNCAQVASSGGCQLPTNKPK